MKVDVNSFNKWIMFVFNIQTRLTHLTHLAYKGISFYYYYFVIIAFFFFLVTQTFVKCVKMVYVVSNVLNMLFLIIKKLFFYAKWTFTWKPMWP